VQSNPSKPFLLLANRADGLNERTWVSIVLGPLSRQGRDPRFDKVSSFIAEKLDIFAERITGGQSWAIRGNRACLIDSLLAVGDRAAF